MLRIRGMEQAASDPLQQYRLYFLDGAGRVASPPFEFKADSDVTAVMLAFAYHERRHIELWCGDRRVPLPIDLQ